MDTQSLNEVWLELTDHRPQLIEAFYTRLFERHPEYRELFPDPSGAPTDQMVDMFSGVAGFSQYTGLLRPHLRRTGVAHRRFGITQGDVKNFMETFLSVLAEIYPGTWEPRHESAWREAFEEVIIPCFSAGLADDGPGPRKLPATR